MPQKLINGSAGTEAPRSNSERTPLLLIAIIVIVAVGVYFNALFNGFIHDDIVQVVENPWIRDVRYAWDILSAHVAGFEPGTSANYYRPLMHFIYMFNYHLFGLSPLGFHLVNIVFHVCVSILVFLLAIKLLKEFGSSFSKSDTVPAFVAGLLFAIHPIHTEAVTWIASLPDLSFTLFYLLSFYFYISSKDTQYGNEILNRAFYTLSVASFVLSVFCKEPALTLPGILLAYDCVSNRPVSLSPGYFRRYIPFVAVIGIYLVLRFIALGGFAPTRRHWNLSNYELILNIFPLFSEYLRKMVLPTDLNAFYVFRPILSIFDWKGCLSLFVVLAFLVVSAVAKKKDKTVFLGLLFISIPLLPVLYVPWVGENAFAERYLYLPSFGYVLLVGAFVAYLKHRSRRSAAVALGGILALSGLYIGGTISRNSVWKDELSLWRDTVKKSPDGAIPHTLLADALLSGKGRNEEAIEHYRIALKLDPASATILNNLGLAYSAKGWVDEAIACYQKALELQPDSPETHNNLGIAYKRKGLIDQAIWQYQKALALRPNHPGLHYNLARVYEMKGLTSMAEKHVRIAREIENKRR